MNILVVGGAGYIGSRMVKRLSSPASELPVRIEARRSGDPVILVADAGKARQVPGWDPELSSLETIIETAWNWEQSFFKH